MPFTVAIVGGGLVGSLAAVTLAKRGWLVDLYELRKSEVVCWRYVGGQEMTPDRSPGRKGVGWTLH